MRRVFIKDNTCLDVRKQLVRVPHCIQKAKFEFISYLSDCHGYSYREKR